jgi:Putative transposase
MLQVSHFQVVFTLPAELRPVAYANPRVVYGLLFDTASSILQDQAATRMEARLGITAVLHTWTAELTYHPHVHCLVTGGGLHLGGSSWVNARRNYLFPGRVLGRLFRGRFLAGLITAFENGELDLGDVEPVAAARAFRTSIRALSKRHASWVVHIEPPKGRPIEHVARYLARYVKRVAISDKRIVRVTDTHVVFAARGRIVCLPGPEFVRRFALHVLPDGFRKIRHYGLYAPGGAKDLLEQARRLLAPATATPEEVPTQADIDATATADPGERCPACGEHRVRRTFIGDFGSQRARGPP